MKTAVSRASRQPVRASRHFRLKPLALALVCLAPGCGVAATGLPPLQVDPSLMGGGAVTAPPAATPAPAPTVQPSPVEQPVAKPKPTPAPPAATQQTAVPVPVAPEAPAKAKTPAPAAEMPVPVAAPAVPREPEPTAAAQAPAPQAPASPVVAAPPREAPMPAAAAPAVLPPSRPQPAAPARGEAVVVARSPEPAPMPSGPRLVGLPPFQVDPALLGSGVARTRVAQGAAPAGGAVGGGSGVVATTPVAPTVRQSYMATPAKPGQPVVVPNIVEEHEGPGWPPLPTMPPGSDPPVIISARDQLKGHDDAEMEAFGDAELVKADQVVRGDYLTYFQPEDEVYAKGNVFVQQKGDTATGPEMRMQLGKRVGYMESPLFHIASSNGRGQAEKMLFLGEDKYQLDKGYYTTCAPNKEDWRLRMDSMDLDRAANVGTAHQAVLEFKDVPILYAPWMNFALKKERKSGFLAPSFGATGKNGPELATPYYWNIAPNYDATVTPRYMGKRGFQLGGEFRYLEPSYYGTVNYETLNDKMAGKNRDLFRLQHTQNFGGGWSGQLNFQKVSDVDYFTDLTTNINMTSQAYLPREGGVFYNGGWWRFTGRVQRWQSLSLAPAWLPYYRLPQLLATGTRHVYTSEESPVGVDFNFTSEYVDFRHPTLESGRRVVLYPSISVPITPVYGYLTPKIGVHMTRYMMDPTTTTLQDTTRVVPIASVDSGLYFERDTDIFGGKYTQTLEPRAYYVYAPYRDQSQLPLFDSGNTGFGLPQIFSENRFVGSDRISDANQLTLGVTSRLLDSMGAERLRMTVAQRYYLKLPKVYIGAPPDRRFSDVLVGVGGQVSREWWLDSYWQYNPDLARSEVMTLGARYRVPNENTVLNMSYRFTPAPVGWTVGGLRQVDVSGQMPLGGGWYGVGRWNFSLLDKKLIEGLAGFEYDGGCWVGRVVMHSLTTGTDTDNRSLFFQLEFNGLSKVGTDPLAVLRQNIFGYQKINDPLLQQQQP